MQTKRYKLYNMKTENNFKLSTSSYSSTVESNYKPITYYCYKPLFQKHLRRLTRKRLDAETGLYYFGARYLDPRTSRWLGVDPAMHQGDYIPSAPIDDEARKRNGNLPGQGGIYNYVNMHVYHYAGNNPVKYVDPDGEKVFLAYNKIHGYNTHGKKVPFQSTFYHTTIIITDKNDNVTHYIESGPDKGKNIRIKDDSYSNDRFASKGLTPSTSNGEWQNQFDGPVIEISPSSLSVEEFESNILSIAENYNNNSNYAAIPNKRKGTTNSNSFAFSTLRKALAHPVGPIFTTPEENRKMAEDKAKVKPSVNEFQVPGWDSDIK